MGEGVWGEDIGKWESGRNRERDGRHDMEIRKIRRKEGDGWTKEKKGEIIKLVRCVNCGKNGSYNAVRCQ